MDNDHRPKVKLVGAWAHGHEANFVLVEEDQPGGANVTVDILARTIESIFERCERLGEHKPTNLWVQVDNTSAENKNQILLKYLAALIFKGTFRAGVMSFLRVGHTHEDIGPNQ